MQALHESLLEVGDVFDDCARFGIVRSLINAGEKAAAAAAALAAAAVALAAAVAAAAAQQ